MSRVEERLGEMEVTLPNLPTPIANYVPAKRAGNLVFTAGQVSAVEGRAYKGKLGATLSLDFPCFASYTLGRDISASHWEHDRCVPAHCFRSGDNEP